jgi:hypothetical protein
MGKAAKTLPWTLKPITAVLNYKVSRCQDSVGAVGGQLEEARGEESGPATCRQQGRAALWTKSQGAKSKDLGQDGTMSRRYTMVACGNLVESLTERHTCRTAWLDEKNEPRQAW